MDVRLSYVQYPRALALLAGYIVYVKTRRAVVSGNIPSILSKHASFPDLRSSVSSYIYPLLPPTVYMVLQVQLAHQQLLVARKGLPGHLVYGWVRNAAELLEKLGVVGGYFSVPARIQISWDLVGQSVGPGLVGPELLAGFASQTSVGVCRLFAFCVPARCPRICC